MRALGRKLGGVCGVCGVAVAALAVLLCASSVALGDSVGGVKGVPRCQLPDSTSTQRANAKRLRIHVVGHRQVDGDGNRWMPYGISVFGGLQDGNGDKAWQPTIGASMAQIKAAPWWHANTVRIQWAEANIWHDVPSGQDVNTKFLEALCSQVQQVRLQHEVAVLSDNTEFPNWAELDPTTETERSWRVIYDEFGNQSGWIAELYNEPRITLAGAHLKRNPQNLAWLWRVWQKGGRYGKRSYIGMQRLLDYVRKLGFKGEIWAQGPFLEVLDDAGRFPLNDPRHDLVYAFHHAGMPEQAASGSTSEWQAQFGYMTARYPVVDAEWNQAAAPKPECNANAYGVVPPYLRYLRSEGIGLLVWSLQPGSMVAEFPGKKKVIASNITKPWDTTNPKDLEHPSRMRRDYACTKKDLGEGTGQWVYDYFRRYNP